MRVYVVVAEFGVIGLIVIVEIIDCPQLALRTFLHTNGVRLLQVVVVHEELVPMKQKGVDNTAVWNHTGYVSGIKIRQIIADTLQLSDEADLG